MWQRKASLAMRTGGDENGMDENGMDEEEDKDAEEVEAGVNPPILPPIIRGNLLHSFENAGDNNDEGEINSSHPTNDDDDRQGPSAAAAMPLSRARGGSEKGNAGDGANPRRSRAFSQPLKTPRKSSLGHREDGNNNNGFLFGQTMSYLVYQNRVKSEQRDCHNKIDNECREHECELCRKELTVQCKENRAQHQLMNVMMMAILNKNNEPKNNSTSNDSPMNN